MIGFAAQLPMKLGVEAATAGARAAQKLKSGALKFRCIVRTDVVVIATTTMWIGAGVCSQLKSKSYVCRNPLGSPS